MHMPEGEPHPSTLPGFRGTRDPERSVTRSRSGRKKKRVKYEDVQPQNIPDPTEDNFPRRCITQLLDGVSHIYYTGKELTNRDSMRVYGTFTTVFKVWKYIAIIPAVRDAVVPYDDTWSILSNERQLLPNIDSSHIKSGNVNIAHLRTYLTVAADRKDDITISRAFIFFMMGHLWLQTANDTVPLRYLAVVNDLDSAAQYDWGYAILASLYHGLDTAVTTGGAITEFVQLLPYWFYEYCGVGHPIVKEEVKYPAYPCLRAWERGNRRKLNDQVTDEVRIPLDPPLSMSPHISLAALHEIRQARFLDCDQFVVGEEGETYASYWAEQISEVGHMLTDFQRMGNIDLFGPTPLRAESVRDAQRFQEVEDELAIACRQIDSIDHQLYAYDLQLRRGSDVRVVPLPPRGGARMRQRGSGPRTRGGGTSHRGRGTGDDSE
ncbi:hypothetical protein GIB67_021994 [Kingdonia uniflora]|uniref:Aminotransferase-like plant mobile domain-containing protein n=1 Tax=Kingdonia uniflora TaxID=39325 RepID=A0A7J7P8M3_9MAGN|nr:hypothetical protein GIB67_021994 [Kingdonia uniflora]